MNAFDPRGIVPPMPACWRRIGTSGDRTCPELERLVHCRNCPVLSEAAREFFMRPPPEGYLEEWTGILADSARTEADSSTSTGGGERDGESVLVFCVAGEWFALPVAALVEVTEPRRVHPVPHRVGGPLEGIVNIRGQLHLCVSLARLLGLPEGRTHSVEPGERLVVVEHAGERWAFRVDRVTGVPGLSRGRLRPPPDTARVEAGGHTRGLFEHDGATVALLDPRPIFTGLRGRVAHTSPGESP
jgi:chemotaxis-related protein WspD